MDAVRPQVSTAEKLSTMNIQLTLLDQRSCFPRRYAAASKLDGNYQRVGVTAIS